MARSFTHYALILALLAQPSLALAAEGQDQAHRALAAEKKPLHKGVRATPAKPKPEAGKAPAKPPQVKALAAKPVQPPAAKATPSAAAPALTEPAKAADDKGGDTKPAEGKVAPHFASLRPDKVFLRSGPSADFPIQWVFMRRGLPVEILATFDIWRKVRTFDGTEGWVHQQMLTARRSVLVTGGVRDLHRDADPGSPIMAQLEPGVVAAISHCNPGWCEVKAGGYKGWIKRKDVWGLEPDEVIP